MLKFKPILLEICIKDLKYYSINKFYYYENHWYRFHRPLSKNLLKQKNRERKQWFASPIFCLKKKLWINK